MKFDPSPPQIRGEDSHARSGPGGSNDGRIGRRLENVRARLLDFTAGLAPQLDGLAQPLLEESRRLLERRSCRIAVIGQIKAGKSTFINAMAGRPGLLPADINPWTAVVTLLHFRDASAPPIPAAVFQFFSETEWNNLAEGSGRLRELTRQLIPDFEPNLLKAQFGMMRARAERRLGSQFSALLGQTHTYNEITYERLTDYISAGDDYPGQPNPPQRPCYSDITRAADLYFSRGPFAFPATLIDTPGINDPFLVRDEISRRSLENPDILIFVISALQPLTAADVAMLRLINGMHKDRILVFINRVDQLNDPVNEGDAIKRNVEMRLAREFPAIPIPVVLGSAAWGNLALQTDRVDAQAAAQSLAPVLLERFGLAPLPTSLMPGSHPAVRAQMAHALHVASGLPQVSATLNALMASSASAALLTHIGTCLLELARGKEIALRSEVAQLSSSLQSRQAETAALQDRLTQEREVLAGFDSRATQLHGVLDEIEGHLTAMVTANMAPLHQELNALVRDFAYNHAATMERSLEHHNPRQPWICDVMPLRVALEDYYVRACKQLSTELTSLIVEIQPVLRGAVEALLPGSGDAFDDVQATTASLRPNVQPLRETVVLDLGVSWWKLGFGAKPDPAERARHLRTLIEGDFFPMTAELVREADAHFGWSIAHTLDKARAVAESIMATVRRRNDELMAAFEQWKRDGEQPGDNAFDIDQCRRAVEVSGRHAHLANDIAELNGLLTALREATHNQETREP